MEPKTIKKSFSNNSEMIIHMNERDMGWGIKQDLNVKFPEFMNVQTIKEHKKEIESLMRYCTNKIHYLQLSKGKELLNEIKDKGIVMPKESMYVFIEDNETNSIIRPFIRNRQAKNSHVDIDISPFISFDCPTAYGFTAVPGSFSDFIITENYSNQTVGYTKDFAYYQFGLTTILLELYSKLFYDFIFNNRKPSDFEEFSVQSFEYKNESYKQIKEKIKGYLEQQLTLNQSEKITMLNIKNESIDTLMDKYDIKYIVGLQHSDIVNIGLTLGKTPYQVKKYIENKIRKKGNYA